MSGASPSSVTPQSNTPPLALAKAAVLIGKIVVTWADRAISGELNLLEFPAAILAQLQLDLYILVAVTHCMPPKPNFSGCHRVTHGRAQKFNNYTVLGLCPSTLTRLTSPHFLNVSDVKVLKKGAPGWELLVGVAQAQTVTAARPVC